MRFSTRLTIILLLLSTLPLVIIGHFAYDNSRKAVEQTTFHHLNFTNALKANDLKRWLRYESRYLRTLASRPLVREYSARLVSTQPAGPVFHEAYNRLMTDHLEPVLAEGGFINLSLLHGSTGMLLISTDKTLEGNYHYDDGFFREGQEYTYIGNIEHFFPRNEAIMRISTPIRDQAGQTVAVLVGQVDLGEMAEIVNQPSDSITTEQTYLISSLSFFITEPGQGQGDILNQNIETEGAELCLKRRDGVSLYLDYRGVPVVGAYQWLPVPALCILTEIDQEEAFAPFILLRNSVLGIGFITGLTAVLVSLFYSRSITRRLQQLVQGVEAVSQGDLEHRIKVGSRDELGRLADAVNRMAMSLSHSFAERKQAEQRISETLDLTQKIVETAPIGILTYNGSGQCVSANDMAATIIGARPGQALVQNFRQIESWKRSGLLEIAEETLAKGIPQRREIHVFTTFGKEVWMDCRFATFTSGNQPHLLMITDDLSLVRQAQQERARALAEAEATKIAAETIEGMLDPVVLTDAEGRITHFNRALTELLGYGEEIIGDFPTRVVVACDVPGVSEAVTECLEQGFLKNFETTALTKGGQEIPMLLNITLLKDSAGSLKGLIVVARDIAARKQAEMMLQEYSQRLEEMVAERTRELEEAQERLVRKEKLAILGQLAGGVSHELRNPLGAIKNAVYFLTMALEQPEPEVQEIIQILQREIDQCTRTVSNLLDFARPKMPVLNPVDLRLLVDEVLTDQVLPEYVQAEVKVDSALPPVMADADQLRMVFSNLIRNAVQAMQPPSSTEAGDLERKQLQITAAMDFARNEVAISFQDSGAGILPDHMSKLFEPLFTTKAKGIGLGLALIKLLIEGHNGCVQAKSEVGRGSTFIVHLPINPAVKQELAESDQDGVE